MMRSEQRGFTLLEVLVAMAVLAISLGALMVSVNRAVEQTLHVQNKTLAHWLALNHIAQWQADKRFPTTSVRSSDEEDYAGQHWFWRIVTSKTPEKDMQRMDIRVWLAADKNGDDAPLIHRFAYLSRP